jgi:dTDP-4-amino-4,6-dideoxygalactose transaminase
VAVCNGTLGLTAAMRALGVGFGDEVIMPAYTFIGSATSALMIGAVPVFVDIDDRTHLLDPSAVEAALTERTAAIMPVHLAGQPCDMDALTEIGARRGVAIVEDAAQALGAEWRGRRVGALGDAGMFSFQTSKNMTAGEGGALVTNSPEVAERLYAQANVGRIPGGAWYQHEHVGFNLRMTEFQGAILREQLRRHPEQATLREANAAYLASLIAEIDGITVPEEDDRVTVHGRNLFMFRVPGLGGGEQLVIDSSRGGEPFSVVAHTEGPSCESPEPSRKFTIYGIRLFDMREARSATSVVSCLAWSRWISFPKRR